VSLRATQKSWIRKEDFSTLFPTPVLSIPVAETRKGAARNEVGKWIGNWYRTDARRLVVLSKFVRKSRYIHLALYRLGRNQPHPLRPPCRSAFTPFRSLEPIRFAPLSRARNWR